MFRKILGLLFVVALLFAAVPVGLASAAEPMKVAFVYVAPIGDLGWTWAHDQGRLMVEKELGNKVETVYIENVPEGPEAERVIRDFAQKGYKLIFTTSFGFMDPTITVAEEFPETWFVHISGYKTAQNVSTVFGAMEQPRFLSGLAAGAATRSNVIGYVAAFPIPEVIRGINAFALGVRETNPQAEVRVVWTNTWFGPQQEKEAAEALLAEGADVIAQHQDTTEPQKAAAEAGKVSIGYDSDMRQFVGDTVLVSPIWNWGLKYVDIAKKVMKGIYAAESYYGDISEGIVDLASLSPRVDQTTANNIVLFRAAMRDKWWDVFCGEVVGQNGVAVQAKGNCLTLEELLSMDWFVEGVKGEAPGVAKEGLGSPNPMANHKPGVYKPSLVIILTTFGYQLKDGSWAGESGPFLNVMLPGGAQDVSTDLPWCDKAILGELHGQKVLQITAGTTKLPASGCAHDLVRSKYMEENPWIVQTGISGFSPRIGGFVGPDGKQVAGDYTEIGDICISEVGVDWDLGFSSMTQQVFWPLTWPSPAQYYKGSEFLAQLLYQTASYVEWPMPPDAPRSNIEKYFGPGSARLPKVWYGNCAESTGDNFWHDRVSDLHARTVVAEGLTKAHGQLLTSDQVFAVTAMENSGLFYTISRWASLTGKQVLFAYARSSSNFDQPWLNPDGSEAVDPATSISDGMDLGGDQFGSLTEFLLIDRWLERLQ